MLFPSDKCGEEETGALGRRKMTLWRGIPNRPFSLILRKVGLFFLGRSNVRAAVVSISGEARLMAPFWEGTALQKAVSSRKSISRGSQSNVAVVVILVR